jgi:hypothetical protein
VYNKISVQVKGVEIVETIKQYQVVVMTSGSYGDYSLNGVFVALQEISKEECERAASELSLEQSHFDVLVKEGKLEKIDATEVRFDFKKVFLFDVND